MPECYSNIMYDEGLFYDEDGNQVHPRREFLARIDISRARQFYEIANTLDTGPEKQWKDPNASSFEKIESVKMLNFDYIVIVIQSFKDRINSKNEEVIGR